MFIKNILQSKNHRTKLIKKNVLFSFLFKFIKIGLDFIIVPLTLSYLTKTNYGIWLIISSMMNWFNLFDLGISHGLRNKLSIALANQNLIDAKKLISTAYCIISLISLLILIISYFIIPLFDWNMLLNIESSGLQLNYIIQIVAIGFCLNLTLKILTSVFLAKQMPLLVGLVDVVSKIIVFIGICILVNYTKQSLSLYVILSSLAPIVILFVFNIIFFTTTYKSIRPSFLAIDFAKFNDIFGLGYKFFLIQLGVVMLFMTDNLIISHIFSPAEVTPYQISKKYFQVILIVYAIIIAPFWSAITEAYEKQDFNWIKDSMNKLVKIWSLMVVFTIILLFLFYPFLNIWVGDKLDVSLALVVQWAIFVILQTYNNIYTSFLNGTGKVSLQLITSLISFVFNIPLSILFAKYFNMGVSGVLLATNCSILMYIITRRIQYKKIINNNAYGLWNS